MLTGLLLAGCLPASRSTTSDLPTGGNGTPLAFDQGEASFYADAFEGRQTASGETFRQDQMTAAHRTYPFGTVLRVTNTANNREVIVRVNDRGPAKESRVLDVTRRAAEDLKMIREGTARVRIEVLKWGG
jgi:rare lipoprotein A